MKRALTGIAAAAVVLGTIAPAAFASTAPALTAGGGKTISLDGTTLYSGVQVGNAKDAGTTTTYFPIWYLQQSLNKAGYTNTYNPSTATWDITMPGVDASKVTVDGGVGSGNAAISINGTVVKKFNAQWAKDLAGGKNASVTTYFPVYYLGNVLAAAGFTNAWDGNSFGFKHAAPATFGIQSVTAVNGQEVDVTFTQPVNANQTFNATNLNVTAVGSSVNPGTLTYGVSADGKTVSIYTTNTLTQGGYYQVSEAGVQDANFNALAPYASTIQVNDKTAPTITAVTANTNQSTTRQVTLSFSEPVQFDLVQVGTVVAGATTTDGGWDYTVTLPSTATALSVGQSYPVTINGLRDFEGNYAANPTTANVTVTQDTTAPTYTLTAVSPSQFKVVFNKKMNTTVNVDSVTVKNAAGVVLPLSGLPSFSTDGKTMNVSLAGSAIPSGQTSAAVSVEVKDLQDSVGNYVADNTSSLTLTKSSVAPTITGARMVYGSSTQVQVTFNEPVTSVLATGDFAISDSKGNTYALTSVGTQDSSNNVVLTTTAPLPVSDTYTVALVVGTVSDASGNTNAAATQKFTYSAPAAAALSATVDSHTSAADATPTDSTSTNLYATVKFNQANVVHGIDPTTGNYYAGAADNVANYTLNGAPLPAGTVINYTAADATNNGGHDEVVLDFHNVAAANLPAILANGGTGVLTVSNIKTTAGATLPFTSQSLVVADKTVPTLSAAYLQGSQANGYTLTVVASEAIATPAAFADFTIMAGGAGGTAVTPDSVSVSSSDPTKVTFTFLSTNTTATGLIHGALTDVTIVPVGGATTTTTDLAGNKFAAGGTAITATNYAN